MLSLFCLSLVSICAAEMTAAGIDREMSEGVTSLGYTMMYGDESMTVINQAVSDMEKSKVLKNKVRLNESIKPMPAEDVKCLMSVDRYCSKEMMHMKDVLIQALKEDCVNCCQEDKDKAGRMVASMMAHDPVAWKLFLTRSALQSEPTKEASPLPDLKLKTVGEPEEIIQYSKKYTRPGFKVRVKRMESTWGRAFAGNKSSTRVTKSSYSDEVTGRPVVKEFYCYIEL